MIKRTCGPIYALVIASLMAPAIALALMAGRVLAEEPERRRLGVRLTGKNVV